MVLYCINNTGEKTPQGTIKIELERRCIFVYSGLEAADILNVKTLLSKLDFFKLALFCSPTRIYKHPS